VIPENVHLNIGSLLFENLDQIDLTGPYEVLSNIPNATHRIYAKSTQPVRDVMGLRIMPDATLAEAPQLDILHVPGGPGQQALMETRRSSAGCVAKRQARRKSFPSAPAP
jgi:cyclohexyl-isocyanide hydratase